jgi:hypothetical protein
MMIGLLETKIWVAVAAVLLETETYSKYFSIVDA